MLFFKQGKTMLVNFVALLVLSPSKAPASQSYGVKFEVAYSEIANTFDILDNVSNWWPGFCEEEYRKYWETKHPFNDEELKLFSEYKKVRETYYNDPDQAEPDPSKNRNGVFSHYSTLTSDPIAEIFYGAKSWDEAFISLSKLVSSEELNFLRKFYSSFRQKMEPFLVESKSFVKVAESIRAKVRTKKASDFFSKVAKFYGISTSINYQILYIWWPPIGRSNATPTGRFLVMRYNPVEQRKEAEEDASVAFHEVVHTISAMQSYETKQFLTNAFLKKCPVIGKLKKSSIVEEPMAVIIGQAIYAKKFYPDDFSWTANWYNQAWINLFSKLAYPLVSESFLKGKKLDDKLMMQLGVLCNDALAAAEVIGAR